MFVIVGLIPDSSSENGFKIIIEKFDKYQDLLDDIKIKKYMA